MRIPSRVTGGLLVTALLTQLTACGTLFYPDRRGQIEGKIDPVIVALDAVGILFYVIPGLIAFGIDFAPAPSTCRAAAPRKWLRRNSRKPSVPTARWTTAACRRSSKANWASACR